MNRQIYLNHTATSWPKAPGLGQEVAKATEEIPFHPGRSGFAADDPMADCGAALARLISSGAIQNVEALFHAAHRLGATTLLDASQTLGLVDVDVQRLEVGICNLQSAICKESDVYLECLS
jgi:hypothetical protein